MTQTLETWYISTLAAKLNATDITCTVATAPTVTAWRMHIYKWNTHAWIKYTGVAGTTLTGVSFVSQTADPATTVTGTAFPAWTAIELVEMHDQMLDKQEWWTISWDVTFSWDVVTSWSIRIPVYADATARDVWIPSPSNGMLIYNTALGIMQQYIGWIWTDTATGTTANASTTVSWKVEISTQSEVDSLTDTWWTWAFLSPTINQLKTVDSGRWVAWETITKNDFIYKEELQDFRIALSEVAASVTLKYSPVLLGDSATNTKRSIHIIWNGVSSTTIKIWIKKTGTPADNATVRIETDDWSGKPSGTLANANATASVAGGTITTTMTETTFTFSGAFTLTDWTRYHIVIGRSWWTDVANYYSIASYAFSARWFFTNLNNGTVWWTASTSVMLSCTFAGTYKYLFCKTSASVITSCHFEWVALSNTAIGAILYFTPQNTAISTFSWLTANTVYYLSNTAGAISTTPGTITVYVWVSNSDWTNILIWSSENIGLYNNELVWWWSFWTWAYSLSFKVKYPTTFTHTASWWSGGVYSFFTKNGISISNTTFTAVPWDIIYLAFNFGTSWPTVTLSEVVYSPRIQKI